jgi:DMSO/TMAO reductase YedYZ molybdopterin-dependent catalytic subunit
MPFVRIVALCSLLVSQIPALAAQQVGPDSIVVAGDGIARRVLHAAELRALPRDSVVTTVHHGSGTFRGVTLHDVLRIAGVPIDSLRGPRLADYLVVEASDGYRVAFGLAELAEDISGRRVLLVDEHDGRPLPAGEGVWRLVVPGDPRASRWVRQVTALILRHAPA